MFNQKHLSARAAVAYTFNARQRQADLCEFKANLVYKASSKTGSKTNTEKIRLEKPKERKEEAPEGAVWHNCAWGDATGMSLHPRERTHNRMVDRYHQSSTW